MSFSDDDLSAYLREQLPVGRSSEIEQALRDDRSSDGQGLRRRLAAVAAGAEEGRSVGAIWREARLSCPTRDELGALLLGALDPEVERYALFHIREVGCRVCAANLADLEEAASRSPEIAQRRKRVFQTSAGHLKTE
ncbi:hypothetical protein [Alienimonas californiensis]|uniref:Uncharacterized protein n=1 Tax=Alienimonas californiensis TaxID=2527989 RepID=A0A517P8F3_9PLAN|nr:hypothetical protein [Alienimonas californiensis]QDT15645.1 hypothetical protein CA12_17300 [Alienimonas californiensis]